MDHSDFIACSFMENPIGLKMGKCLLNYVYGMCLTHVSILFVGQRQMVETQIRRCKTQSMIRVSTICLQNILLKFESKSKPFISLKTEMNWSN